MIWISKSTLMLIKNCDVLLGLGIDHHANSRHFSIHLSYLFQMLPNQDRTFSVDDQFRGEWSVFGTIRFSVFFHGTHNGMSSPPPLQFAKSLLQLPCKCQTYDAQCLNLDISLNPIIYYIQFCAMCDVLLVMGGIDHHAISTHCSYLFARS